jgi:histidine ammonia-lyase
LFVTNRYEDAKDVLALHGLQPTVLQPKEGLALINGTQFISAIGSEAVIRAKECARVADLVAAFAVEGWICCLRGLVGVLTVFLKQLRNFVFCVFVCFVCSDYLRIQVLQGTWKAYLPQIHAVRPHKGTYCGLFHFFSDLFLFLCSL